jgi:putative ABC transport system substrate-binding protein
MKRREFVSLLGGAAAAWPLAARAQQDAIPVIGFVSAGGRGALRRHISAFQEGLKEFGYVEGQNVAVEYRFAEGQSARLPVLVSELIKRQVAVLVVTGSATALAAKQATTTIPIGVGEDPLATGLVASLNRPGGNLTGAYQFTSGLEGKRLGLLHEVVPKASRIGALINPDFSAAQAQLRELEEAAPRLGVQLVVVRANVENDFETAFSTLVREKATALLVCASPFFFSRHQQIVVLAARHALPAIYEWRDFPATGGLMSYGTNLADAYRQAGVYAARILKGAKPADLPVVQSTKFELVINLQAAKALAVEVPNAIQLLADEVIE